MKNCQKCGVQNSDEAKFCWSCGFPFEEASATMPSAATGPANPPSTQETHIMPQAPQFSTSFQPQPQSQPTGYAMVASPQVPSGVSLFFNWIGGCFKAPGRIISNTPAAYGIIVNIIVSFFIGLSTTAMVFEGTSLLSIIPGMNYITGSVFNANVFFAGLFLLWIGFGLVLFASSLAIWVTELMFGNRARYLEVNTGFARIIVPFFALFILVMLPAIGPYIWILAMIFLMLVDTVLIGKIKNSRNVDSIWMWVLAQLVTRAFFAVIVFPVFGLLVWAIISVAVSSVTGPYGSSVPMPTAYISLWMAFGFIF
jgi:hypothetical protein